MLTQERLKELLYFDRDFGTFHWLKNRGNARIGSLAGSWQKVTGYWRIKIDNKIYRRARLAHLWDKGYFPEHSVDHKNRVRWDDRPSNLWEANSQCQSQNQGLNSLNTSGIKGVHHRGGRWHSMIKHNGKNKRLGSYSSKTEAAIARYSAEKILNWNDCNNTSSARAYLINEGVINS